MKQSHSHDSLARPMQNYFHVGRKSPARGVKIDPLEIQPTIVDYRDKVEYVRQNPVRKSLVPSPECWPHRGTIHLLRW